MARFGRDSAWRTMATLGALDELRHAEIPLLLGHDLLGIDGNFDWTHRAYHTTDWVMIVARHLFDDMILAADAIEVAVQLNFVFETGFTNLQFMAMAAMADGVRDHLFEKALTSIQTDEARHAQIGHPVLRTLIDNGEAQRAQYLVDKMWWRSWRVLITLTGTSMEYLTPVEVRTKSFRRIHGGMDHRPVHEEPGRVRPRAPLVLGVVPRRAGLRPPQPATRPLPRTVPPSGSTSPCRHAAERLWLASAYPRWEETFGTLWDEVDRSWQTKGEPDTLGYALPALCNLCQLPTVFVRPSRTPPAPRRRMAGATSSVPSPAAGSSCRSWIASEGTRVLSTELSLVSAKGLPDLFRWMSLEAPTETGKDLRRGVDQWRLDPVPHA